VSVSPAKRRDPPSEIGRTTRGHRREIRRSPRRGASMHPSGSATSPRGWCRKKVIARLTRCPTRAEDDAIELASLILSTPVWLSLLRYF
jgi:hypothetical protein